MPEVLPEDRPTTTIELSAAVVTGDAQPVSECSGSTSTKCTQTKLDEGTDNEGFYKTKLTTGRYYMARQLPATALHLSRIQSGAEPVMALDAANF